MGITTEEDTGRSVVEEAISEINSSGLFADEKDFLLRIAWVESRFGEHSNTFRAGYNGGIFQVDRCAFDEITKNAKNHNQLFTKIIPKIKDKFDIDWDKVEWKDLRKPLYSALAARLYLSIKPSAIPTKLEDQGDYWKTYYNTGAGKGTAEKFVEDVKEMDKKK